MLFMAPRPLIGTRIRRAMERRRMDQAELAARLGVSRSAVSAWINNRAWPQKSIGALEDLLGVNLTDDPDELLTAEEQAQVEAFIAAIRAGRSPVSQRRDQSALTA